jgi:hypothetical protein
MVNLEENITQKESLAHQESLRKLREHFGVHNNQWEKWYELTHGLNKSGNVCRCGHPIELHDGSAGLCGIDTKICCCTEPNVAAKVSDLRYFFRASLGPFESHALARGLKLLVEAQGAYELSENWTCLVRNCASQTRVGVIRTNQNNQLRLRASVTERHIFMCETCYLARLN